MPTTHEQLQLIFGSEFPTERAPERAASAAKAAVQALADEGRWCDSEAPTGVATERPILPRPPRTPRV
ncbi:MAG TPA: hypothetical protein VNG33_18250 [Polyangiaceae bacterium]|nr:hypothetical protein [Polyangiaceae bacterium]